MNADDEIEYPRERFFQKAHEDSQKLFIIAFRQRGGVQFWASAKQKRSLLRSDIVRESWIQNFFLNIRGWNSKKQKD